MRIATVLCGAALIFCVWADCQTEKESRLLWKFRFQSGNFVLVEGTEPVSFQIGDRIELLAQFARKSLVGRIYTFKISGVKITERTESSWFGFVKKRIQERHPKENTYPVKTNIEFGRDFGPHAVLSMPANGKKIPWDVKDKPVYFVPEFSGVIAVPRIWNTPNLITQRIAPPKESDLVPKEKEARNNAYKMFQEAGYQEISIQDIAIEPGESLDGLEITVTIYRVQ